jgi:hypothetical protein
MAAAHQVAQNPELRDEVDDWVALGENVGMGPDAASVDAAFLTSQRHRANIFASDYTQVGIGAVVAPDGTLFVVEDFRRPAHVAAPAPRAVPRQQASQPVPAATRPAAGDSPTGSAAATQPAAVPSLADRLAAVRPAAPRADPLARAAVFARAVAVLSESPLEGPGESAGRTTDLP